MLAFPAGFGGMDLEQEAELVAESFGADDGFPGTSVKRMTKNGGLDRVLARTPLGLAIRAVGENPEAADVAGISVFRIRYLALMIGGMLMAVGGAFITLSMLGIFTLDIIAGRGWVCIALVIFGRWRIVRGVIGALVFAAVYSLGLRLRITPGFEGVPNEIMLALPYVVVIAALALSGRNVPYPGAYLKAYRRT